MVDVYDLIDQIEKRGAGSYAPDDDLALDPIGDDD